MPILTLEQPFPLQGLGTFTYTVVPTVQNPLAAGVYNVKFQGYLPNALGSGDGAGSGSTAISGAPVLSALSVVVNQNGSPKYTSPAVTPTQGAIEFKAPLLCALNDVITVVLSSSSPADSLTIGLKSITTIGIGE